ncbi:hypothetical protein LJFMMFNO_00125 [Streptococcus equi subsp. zooepidemicus]|nr:hypothetical protein HIEAAJJG_00123 [Streptococcus equi subsp. zooepidemicus]QUQ79135.1 hypothetical protein LJFMMFNO_00125 [Streptococcus equi subsp. zooepidemicus]
MIRLATATGVLEIMTVFRTSEIGTIAQGAESSGAFLFSLGRKSPPTALQEVRKMPPVLIGGAHIHEMYSKPLIRKGLRLVGYTEVIETLVGEGLESLFV